MSIAVHLADPRLLAARQRIGRPGAAVTERGQASIETIGMFVLVFIVAFGGWDMLSALNARDRAHRMVDQAVVLKLEGKPLPAALRGHVEVSRRHGDGPGAGMRGHGGGRLL